MEEKEMLLEEIISLVEQRKLGKVKEILSEMNEADIAPLFEELEEKDKELEARDAEIAALKAQLAMVQK